MSRGPKYSTDPSMVARGSYPSYPFQMKPASSANPNTQPPFGPAEPFRETNKNPEYGLANAPGAVSIPPMDWAINVLRLEKSKHTETLTALHSVQKSNLHLENLLRQERSFNHILRQKAQEAEMERIFLEGQLRVFQQQNMVCGLLVAGGRLANKDPGARNAIVKLQVGGI